MILKLRLATGFDVLQRLDDGLEMCSLVGQVMFSLLYFKKGVSSINVNCQWSLHLWRQASVLLALESWDILQDKSCWKLIGNVRQDILLSTCTNIIASLMLSRCASVDKALMTDGKKSSH